MINVQPLIDAEVTWRSIFGYDGVYLVSDTGLIYSEARTEFVASGRTGGHFRYRQPKLLTPKLSNSGYLQIGLHLNGRCRRESIHRIVAKTFVPNPEGLPEVNHLDGNKVNNRADNLVWSNRSQNSLHSTRVLGKNRGTDNTKAKLNDIAVVEICRRLNRGDRQSDIAVDFNVTNSAIHRIHRGYNWSWLTGFGERGLDVAVD